MSTVRIEERLESADRMWHLRQTRLLSGLSSADLSAIASICRDGIYQRNEVVFNQGDPAESLYLLNRGCVVLSATLDGREKILGIYTNGDIFGENLMGAQRQRQARAVAHEECWVSIISREQFVRLMEQRPSIAMNYMKILNERLLEAREDLKAHSFLDTERRLAWSLLKLSKSHGRPLYDQPERVKLKILLSHEHLAKLIGGNRPHVSMIMSTFKKKGWIDYHSRKLIIDARALKNRLKHSDHRLAFSGAA